MPNIPQQDVKQQQYTSKKPEINYFLWVQSKLAEDQNVSNGACRVFLLISNFLNKHGFAHCSNEWLASKMAQDTRQIQRYLDDLQEHGYIWREIIKDRWNTVRNIWVPNDYLRYLMDEGKIDEKFMKHIQKLKDKKTPNNGSSTPGFKKSLRRDKNVMVERDANVALINKNKNKGKEKTTKKEKDEKRAESEPKTFEGSDEPPLLSPLEKPTKVEQTKESLPLFHPSQKYLKGLSDTDVGQLVIFYEKQKGTITNPIGWVTECIKHGWFRETMVTDADLQQNFQLATTIARNFEKMGFNAGMTYLYAESNGIAFLKAGVEIGMPSYHLPNDRFKEMLSETLINTHSYPNKIFT